MQVGGTIDDSELVDGCVFDQKVTESADFDQLGGRGHVGRTVREGGREAGVITVSLTNV